MDIVVSGIRPTGLLHLGNYFGALRNFIKMQNENRCYFFIADYHSLTTHPKAEHLLYPGGFASNGKQPVRCGQDFGYNPPGGQQLSFRSPGSQP